MTLVERARQFEADHPQMLRNKRSNAGAPVREIGTEPGPLPATCVARNTCQRLGPCRAWLGRDCSIELAVVGPRPP